MYSIRYPEFKEKEAAWTIRQTGLYHQFNAETRQSIYILFSPLPNSRVHQLAAEFLLGNPKEETESNPFWLHRSLFSVYLPAWRQYIAAHERELLGIVSSPFVFFATG